MYTYLWQHLSRTGMEEAHSQKVNSGLWTCKKNGETVVRQQNDARQRLGGHFVTLIARWVMGAQLQTGYQIDNHGP